MWIAARFPLLAIEIFQRGSSAPEPFAVEERHCVAARDAKAAARGVRTGMAVSAARALAPRLRVATRDRAGETEALLGVAAWARQFTPGVALEFPSTLLLEVSGSLKLFGGLEALLKHLREGLEDMGWSALLAGAPTPRAAAWFASTGTERFVGSAELEAALAELPAKVLPQADETLAAIGVCTLGGLLALPRAGVARRFGQGLLDDLDRARGRLPDPRSFFVPPVKFRTDLELPAEVTQAEAVFFAAKRLTVQLAGFLAARSGGVQRFVLGLRHRDAAVTRIEVGLVAPSRDAAHFALLLRERLANVPLAAPVRALVLQADDVVSLPGSNAALLLEPGKPPGRWEPLVERLRSRLGAEAVHGLVLKAEHRPEHASAAAEPGCTQPQLDFGTRPLWLLERPEPLPEIGPARPMELLAGPERIESGWWEGEETARDYFIARAQDESLVWIYREWRGRGGWYLHGIFA